MAITNKTCPTCSRDYAITTCDNCQTVIPEGQQPAINGVVRRADSTPSMPLVLCDDCARKPLVIDDVVQPSQPETDPTVP